MTAHEAIGRPPEKPDGVAAGIVQWLISRQAPSGAIRGQGDEASPNDHYAHSFAALAMGLLAAKERCSELWAPAERAVNYTFGISSTVRRQQEFNSLALLMLTDCARGSTDAPERLRTTLEAAIRDPAFLYDGGRTVSNNWLAMRAVCFLMRARLIGEERSRERGEALLRETLDRQLPDGVFVDFPRHGREAYATPLTYHAKTCAMLALAAGYTAQETALPALYRGLDALTAVMSPHGECLYYGRSCNSLFGLAAAYYALRYQAVRESQGEWGAASERVWERLAERREADGHLRLTPDRDEARRSGWDVYYHTEVYNAYAAALLLAAPTLETATPPRCGAIAENSHLRDAGLLAIRGPQFFAALSARGQCALDGSSFFCDMRYSGLQPLLIETAGTPQAPEPPLAWRGPQTKGKAVSPRNAGFMPYIAWNGRDYCARVFEPVAVRAGDAWHLAWGSGEAISLSLPPRWLRLARRIRGKLTGRGDLAFTPRRLPGLRLLRAILVFPTHQTLLFVDGYEGVWPGGATWNGPNARLLPNSALTITGFLGPPLSQALDTAPTSRGEAVLWTSAPTSEPTSGCVSAYACGPRDMRCTVEQDGASRLNICLEEIRLCLNLQTGHVEEERSGSRIRSAS